MSYPFQIGLCRYLRPFVFLFFGLVFVAAQEKPARENLRVLFVGNSLTYVNNVPEIVAQMAKAGKQRKLSYKMVAYPDFSLEDHWNKGEVQKLLAKQKWDFVVMQQGPSASDEGRGMLVEYSKKFLGAIRASGAEPALYMVWSSADRTGDFVRAGQSYRLAAKEVGGIVIPAGEAWLEAWKLDPKLELYSSDRFHPNQAGSYLAALVIYQQLFKQSPRGLPGRFRLNFQQEIDVSREQTEILQKAAAEANRKYGFQ